MHSNGRLYICAEGFAWYKDVNKIVYGPRWHGHIKFTVSRLVITRLTLCIVGLAPDTMFPFHFRNHIGSIAKDVLLNLEELLILQPVSWVTESFLERCHNSLYIFLVV